MRDKINTFEDILKINGTTMEHAPKVDHMPAADGKRAIALWCGEQITLAYNGGKRRDVTDRSTTWYEPWVRVVKDESKETGFGFSYSCYADVDASTRVGSRLSFADPHDCLDALKKFEQILIPMYT